MQVENGFDEWMSGTILVASILPTSSRDQICDDVDDMNIISIIAFPVYVPIFETNIIA